VLGSCAAGRPEDPSAYELTIPEDVDYGDMPLPESFQVQPVDHEEFAPVLDEFRAFLHEIGAPADAAPKAMGVLAKFEAMKASKAFQQLQSEFSSIERAEERLSTVQRALQNRLSEGEAASVMGAIQSADGLRALEKLIGPSGPKSSTPTTAASEPDNLTPLERLQRARAG